VEERRLKTQPAKKWEDTEIEQLIKLYPEAQWETIEEMIPGRSQQAICIMAHKLGIHRKIRTVTMDKRISSSLAKIKHGRTSGRTVCLRLHYHGQEMKDDPERLDSQFMLKLVKSLNGPIAIKEQGVAEHQKE
jgi:hypothetical protein